MNDCIFCKIIRNEIPNVAVYEDDVVKAFLDITQVTPGHTLIVPKNMCRTFLPMTLSWQLRFLNAFQKLRVRLKPAIRRLRE